MRKMKITEKIILEKIGLKVGDIVYFNDDENVLFEITEETNDRKIFFKSISHNRVPIQLCDIIYLGYDINVINMNGIWENARCRTHIDCKDCPLRMLSCNSGQKPYEETENKRLKDIYSTMKKYFKENCKIEDDEISNFIEKRLKERIQDKTLREIVEQSME